jgi:hypothetical protein
MTDKFESDQLKIPANSNSESELFELLNTTGVYSASSVKEIPDLTLQLWRVYEVTGWNVSEPTRHFSGYCPQEGPGRASTPIMAYDPNTRIGTTASGRKYQLEGESSWNGAAAWVWDQFCAMNKLTVVNDVSAEYAAAPASDVANP